jgi:hypothetical protein
MRTLKGNSPKLRKKWKMSIGVLMAAFTFLFGIASASPRKLAATAEYHRYIDPLLGVADFQMQYCEDGAADATFSFQRAVSHPTGI